MAENNKLTDIIETSLEQIRNVVDANTIIGTPINTLSGTTIIPVSKVVVGFASGGVDYVGKNAKKAAAEASAKNSASNFGGGGGTGVTVQPVGFLVITPDGNVDLLNVGGGAPAGAAPAAKSDPIDQVSNLLEKAPDLLTKIKNVFVKNDVKADDKPEEIAVEKSAPASEKSDEEKK